MHSFTRFFAATMIIVGIATSASALAADIRYPETEGGNISIRQGEELTNLYAAGAIVSVDGNVEKGVHAAGGTVIINGNVGQDVHAAGRTVILKGNVGGSAHLAGADVIIEGAIADDLFVGSGSIRLAPTASVGGDLILGSGSALIEGPIGGDILIGAGEATINSTVGGDIKGSFERITLGAEAEITGNFSYEANSEAILVEGATVSGETTFKQIPHRRRTPAAHPFRGFFQVTLAFAIIKVLALMLAGLILIYPLRKLVDNTLKESVKDVWINMGIGFATMLLTPIAIILLAVTIVGLPLSVLLGTAFLFCIFLSSILASVVFGSIVIKHATNAKNYEFRWQEVVLGTPILGLINFVPFLGWLVTIAFFWIALGTMTKMTYKYLLTTKK